MKRGGWRDTVPKRPRGSQWDLHLRARILGSERACSYRRTLAQVRNSSLLKILAAGWLQGSRTWELPSTRSWCRTERCWSPLIQPARSIEKYRRHPRGRIAPA